MATPHRTPSPERGDDHTEARAPVSTGDAPQGDRGRDQDPEGVDETVRHLEDRLRWVTADLENLRRRFDREVRRERDAARGQVAAEWLPVIDNLDLALHHVDEATSVTGDAVVAGMGVIRDQALAVLERLGFSRFDDVGAPFDPTRHEAVGTVESDAPANTVVAAVRPGYQNGEEVLRPAAVVVSRSRDAPSAVTAGAEGSRPTGSASREPR
jgi:molecular chaperone GrpE